MIVEIDSVELNFDKKRILYGVYLKAETGKVTGVLGRNGSGKTCLLRILFGDLKPKYKNVRIDGSYLKKKLYQTDSVAYLPQHQLLPQGIKLKNAFRLFNAHWSDFINLFDSFKIHEKSKSNQLSSGELRVIETYLVLNSGKEIILLDEPFSFIAPLYIEKFKILLLEKKKQSVIMITDHFYRDILKVSDTIYFLKNGSSKQIKYREELETEGYLNINLPQK